LAFFAFCFCYFLFKNSLNGQPVKRPHYGTAKVGSLFVIIKGLGEIFLKSLSLKTKAESLKPKADGSWCQLHNSESL